MTGSTDTQRYGAIAWFGAFALAVLVLAPLWDTGFTTNDDLRIATHTFCNDLLSCARSQGRFQFLLSGHLWGVPYLVDHPAWFQAVRLGSVLLNFVLLGLLVRSVCGSTAVGGLAFLFALGFVQDSWDHSLLTSYPLILTAGINLVMLSLLAFVRYLRTTRWPWLAASCVAYFLAMSNEAVVPYAVVFVALAWFFPIATHRAAAWRGSFAIVGTAVLFVTIYTVFRLVYPSAYDGSQLGGSWIGAARVVLQYSLAALPGYYFHAPAAWKFLQPLVPGAAEASSAFDMLLRTMRPEWLAKAALMGGAAWYAWWQLARQSWRTAVAGLLLAFGCVFLPNVAMALSPKYQLWAASGIVAYTTTYLSHLAMSVFGALLAALVAPRLSGVAGRVAAFGFALAIAYLSVATDFNNHHVAADQRRSQAKFRMLDAFFRSESFAAVPEGGVLYAPSLFEHRGTLNLYPHDLDAYAAWRTGRSVRIVGDMEELATLPAGPRYYLGYGEETHGDRRYLLFAPVEADDPANPVARQASLFLPADAGPFALTGATRGEGEVKVDGIPVDERRGSAFAAHVTGRASADGDVRAVRIASEAGLDLRTFSLSFLLPLPTLGESAIGTIDWRESTYPAFVHSVTGVANRESWGAWTLGPRAVIRFTRPLPERFRLVVVAGAIGANVGAAIPFTIGGETELARFDASPFGQPATVTLEFAPEQPAHELVIEIPAPEAHPPDVREVGLGLIELSIVPVRRSP